MFKFGKVICFVVSIVCLGSFNGVLAVEAATTNINDLESCDYLVEIPLDLWEERTLYFQEDVSSASSVIPPVIETHYGVIYDLSVMGSEFYASDLISSVALINAELMDANIVLSGVRILRDFTVDVARIKRYVGKFYVPGQPEKEEDKFALEISPNMARHPERILSTLLQENPLTESEMYRKEIQQARRETLESVFDDSQVDGEEKKKIGAAIVRTSGKAISAVSDYMEGGSKINLEERFKNMVIVDEFDKFFDKIFDLSQVNQMRNLKKTCSDVGQESTVALQRLGIQQLLQEQYAEAAVSFKTALDQSPNVFKLYNALAFALISQGDLAQAAQYLEKGIALKSNEAYVHSNLGLIFYELGIDDKALINMIKALDLNPKMVGLNLYLGYSYVFLNDHKKAIEHLVEIEKFYQHDAEFLLLMANSYQALNQNDLASVYFEKSRQLNPVSVAP